MRSEAVNDRRLKATACRSRFRLDPSSTATPYGSKRHASRHSSLNEQGDGRLRLSNRRVIPLWTREPIVLVDAGGKPVLKEAALKQGPPSACRGRHHHWPLTLLAGDVPGVPYRPLAPVAAIVSRINRGWKMRSRTSTCRSGD